MKVWFVIALVVVAILLLWRRNREGFETPKAPVELPNPGGERGTYKGYDVAETTRIWNMLTAAEKDAIAEYNQRQSSASYWGPDARTSSVVSEFYQAKYSPSTPVTPEVIDAYVEANKAPFGKDPWTAPMVAAYKRLLKAYFIDPNAGGASSNAAYNALLAGLGQGAGYSTPGGPTGGTGSGPVGGATGGTGSGPVGGATGGTGSGPVGGVNAGATGGVASGAGGAAMTSSGNTTGNTTGGSSTNTFGPTSGGGAGAYNVWGPIMGERGESSGVDAADTSKTAAYPTLLGGMGGAAGDGKTRIDGVGLVAPSSSWQLSMSGLLPDSKSLGTTEDSKYLPYSRAPGDLEKIPDPWRVNQTYTTSSYSSKTEPVPFLADFSAFQK